MLMAGTQGQVVLAGDPKQMPPLVFDIYARDRGLSRSFLCRLLERYSKLKNNDNYIVRPFVHLPLYDFILTFSFLIRTDVR